MLALSPEETLPGGEVSAFEERVLQNALHAAQRLDHIRAVVVQVPQFSIVSLVGPPEWILLQHLHSHKIDRIRTSHACSLAHLPSHHIWSECYYTVLDQLTDEGVGVTVPGTA